MKRRGRLRLLLFWMFLFLGFQTGVWAMLLDDLVSDFQLSPGQLGMALTLQSGAVLLSLWLGGRIADKTGRKPVALLGIGGTGIFFISLAFVERDPALLAAFIAGGIFISWYDLIANTLGGDYERNYSSHMMTHLHAVFSGGAAVGAWASGLLLARGVTYTKIYLLTGSALVLLAVLSLKVQVRWERGRWRGCRRKETNTRTQKTTVRDFVCRHHGRTLFFYRRIVGRFSVPVLAGIPSVRTAVGRNRHRIFAFFGNDWPVEQFRLD